MQKEDRINSEFIVNFNNIHKGRKNGVSGMMRVRNDSEFIEECVESCINSLDELVIVYNDCSDESPSVIRRMQDKYPSKIKVFEYKPWIYTGNLSDHEYNEAKRLPIDSVHLLSNYYNYALSKTSYTYVMKIDADQFYFSDRLSEICDLYRKRKYTFLSITEIIILFKVYLKRRTTWFENLSLNEYLIYNKCIKKLISSVGITTSYSGINIIIDRQQDILIPLGKETDDLNILLPFNGVGDHLIFKVTSKTRFIPFDDKNYNIQTSKKNTYIERLIGNSHVFLNGFLWWHLNGIRKNIFAKQLNNIAKYPESFISFPETYNMTSSNLSKKLKSKLFNIGYKQMMDINKNIYFPCPQDNHIMSLIKFLKKTYQSFL